MYSLRRFHIWLYTQLLALTFSYVQSVTPTLNYNHTLTLPIQLHHQCCPPPPTLNYNHVIKPAILHLQYNPALAFTSPYAQQLSLGCTSAHHIHAHIETPDFFFHSDSRVFFIFCFNDTKSTHFLPRNRKTCCSYGMLASQKITLNPYFIPPEEYMLPFILF